MIATLFYMLSILAQENCTPKYIVKLSPQDRETEKQNPETTEVYKEAMDNHMVPVEVVTLFSAPEIAKSQETVIPTSVSKLFTALYKDTGSNTETKDKYTFLKGDLSKYVKDDQEVESNGNNENNEASETA